jgi:von Willebrand factor type A domain
MKPSPPLPKKSLPAPPQGSALPRVIVPQKTTLWKKVGGTTFLIAVLLHAIFLVICGLWILDVMQEKKPVPDFVPHGGGGGSGAPVKMAQPKMMSQNLSRIAAVNASSGLTLPEPELGASMVSLSDLSTGSLSAVGGTGGKGTGSGGGNGSGKGLGTGPGVGPGMGAAGAGLSGLAFFGIKDQGQSVVIMIDVSDSMFGRTGDLDYATRSLLRHGKEQSFQRVRDEAIKLIDSLKPDSRFNIIRWSGSARCWQRDMVPATAENKELAKQHVQNEVDAFSARAQGRPGGTRHDYALEELFRLDPEVAFMLSDGNATRSGQDNKLEVIPERELVQMINKSRDEKLHVTKIHTIYYVTGKDNKEEAELLRAIARATKGDSKKVEAEIPKDGSRRKS